MKPTRSQVVSLLLVAAAFALAAALYARLPESVPTHWNASGVADGFVPKPWGPFVLPLVMLGMFVALFAMPGISPRGYGLERFQGVFELLRVVVMEFLFVVTALVLFAGIGAPIPMDRAVYGAAGLVFVVLGNFMGKLTRNFFLGIRTPWTLASEEVWLRTHRLAGKLFVLAGLALMAIGVMGGGVIAVLVTVAAAAGIPAVFSYVLYRRLEGITNSAEHGNQP
jgi:uncharacterized membrane protein